MNDRNASSGGKTLFELMHEHIEHMRSLNMSKTTIKGVLCHVGIFLKWLAEVRNIHTPESIRIEDLDLWRKHTVASRTPKGRPMNPESINNRLSATRTFLRRLARQGHAHPMLAESIVYVKVPKTLGGSALNHAQIRKILSGIPLGTPQGYTQRAMLETLYTTGVRRSELLGMNIHDVDFENRTILVTGKGEKQRLVPIGRTATRYLETYVKAVRPYILGAREEQALFLNSRGKRMPEHTLSKSLHEVTRRAGIDLTVTPHTFRRSCATELIRAGANLYHVKDLLGHESLTTLRHYTRLTITDLKATHQKCHPRERDK